MKSSSVHQYRWEDGIVRIRIISELGLMVIDCQILESWLPSFNDACDCRDAGITLIFRIDDAFVVAEFESYLLGKSYHENIILI